MSSIAAGYDQEATQFSPEGRIFQVEYAKKALLRSGTAIGLRGKDCVVLAAEKISSTKLHESATSNRIFSAASHIGVAFVGYVPDGKHLLQTALTEAVSYKLNYKQDIPMEHLKLRMAMYMHAYTLYCGLRPFGAGFMITSYYQSAPKLFTIDPYGTACSYIGCAMGKNEDAAKAEIEKLHLRNMSSKELVKEAARILYMIHEENDQNFDLELSWVGKNTNGKHLKVPDKVLREAKEYALNALEERNSDEEI